MGFGVVNEPDGAASKQVPIGVWG